MAFEMERKRLVAFTCTYQTVTTKASVFLQLVQLHFRLVGKLRVRHLVIQLLEMNQEHGTVSEVSHSHAGAPYEFQSRWYIIRYNRIQ